MMQIFRKRGAKLTAVYLLVSFFGQIIFPSLSFALTGGPNQPEAGSFTASSMDNMVDPFTGDFSYNIPLLDVGGYPISLNYGSGISPDDEASWVGLGWNLNVGSISRSVRGIPDDYAGEEIVTEHSVKPNQTFGITFQAATESESSSEILTFPVGVGGNYDLSYNTYNGVGFSYSWGLPLLDKKGSRFNLGVDLGLSIGSEGGVGITPKISVGAIGRINKKESTLNASIGFPYSSREGAKGMQLKGSFSRNSNSKAVSELYRQVGINSFQGFATPTYPTNIEYDNFSVNASLSLAPEDVGLFKDNAKFILGGYYNGQFESNDKETNRAYGYMYQGVNQDLNSVQDFNREKDKGFNLKTTNMPLTNHTYDVFSVSGQGVGGSFRMFRGDVSMVGDNASKGVAIAPSLGLSGGINAKSAPILSTLKIGADVDYVQTNTRSGRWGWYSKVQHEENPLGTTNSINQNVYLGMIGDKAPDNDPDFYNNTLLGDELFEARLDRGFVTGQYEKKNGQVGQLRKNGEENYKRKRRKNRTNGINYLTASQAKKYNLREIESYSGFRVDASKKGQNIVSDVYSDKISIERVSDGDKGFKDRKGHHLSEIAVTNDNGQRFVYGIPVYNNFQEDVTFSVGTNDIGDARKTGLVGYSGNDASVDNNQGLEHYFQKRIQPAHASSYLLTYVLSSDYVDRDGIAGPSDGDLGTYVKFNYERTSTDYKWRTPYQKDKATFSDGLAGKRNDDKGSYTYGTKELWFLHSVETRTHVAEFHTSFRDDAIGVKGENGGMSTADSGKKKKLDKVVLYAKRDKLNGHNEPLKTTHFKYNYSLCPKTPNSVGRVDGKETNGKLTLEKVWFTYGNSNKGIENPYTFKYGDQNFDGELTKDENEPYSIKNYDRWGTFKKELSGELGNEVFPYTDQDTLRTDKYVGMYSLTTLFTPEGGEMRVHYESDDYGYVQDKQAMRMFNILGCSEGSDGVLEDKLFELDKGLNLRSYMHVDLDDGFKASSESEAVEYFKDKYLRGDNSLQYKVKMNVVNGGGLSSRADELVPGYCEIDLEDISLKGEDGVFTKAIIKLVPEGLNKRTNANIHPFVKNGWLYGKLHYSRELHGSSAGDDPGFRQILGTISSSVTGILSFVFGFRGYMKAAGHSNTMIPNESFVRMYEPDKIKLGGGHRVKAIINFDRWDEMTSNREVSGTPTKEVSGYGQVYNYRMKDDTDPLKPIISSGIAAYEPIIGGDENSLRKLVKTVDKVPLAPDKEYYNETPFGESFFPAPVVGYRKITTTPVKVISKSYDVDKLQSNGTGYIEEEFYTAYDFPTRVSNTSLTPYRDKSSLFNPLKFRSHDHVSCSQGYMIELNDMHGKPKSKKVMPDNTTGDAYPISEVSYKYRVDSKDARKINCLVPLVDKHMAVATTKGRELGTTVDLVHDTRMYQSKTYGGGVDVNARITWGVLPFLPPLPYVVPLVTAFPNIKIEETSFSSITTTKVVNRYGVLEETIAKENGQTISTKNLAWDGETGQVLVTSVQNEFHDPIYKLMYPGHWVYPQMGMAYNNVGLEFDNLETVKSYLLDGDEVVFGNLVEKKDYYAYYDKIGNRLITKDGTVVASASSPNIGRAKVVRSGARNAPSVPVSSVSLLDNPISGDKISFTGKKILSTDATEFKSVWKGFCNCGEQAQLADTRNPFVSGERGQLRPWKSWTYLTGRTQEKIDGELQIRKDGVLEEFTPFWNLTTNGFTASTQTNSNWTFVTQVENFNPLGQEIENKDVLNRYSAAQFGYGKDLNVSVTKNSEYRESGFDGFEDYGYGDCNDDHFSWRIVKDIKDVSVLDSTESHTGKHSLKVYSGKSAKIIKQLPCEGE